MRQLDGEGRNQDVGEAPERVVELVGVGGADTCGIIAEGIIEEEKLAEAMAVEEEKQLAVKKKKIESIKMSRKKRDNYNISTGHVSFLFTENKRSSSQINILFPLLCVNKKNLLVDLFYAKDFCFPTL